MSEFTHTTLKNTLHYDPVTGMFTWLPRVENNVDDRRWNSRFAGKRAGTIQPRKDRPETRRCILFCKISYWEHRLAWLYMTGEWPKKNIDHINGDPSDNRWANLRECNQSQNSANSRLYISNTSGYKGVYFEAESRKWKAHIRVDGRLTFLGRYPTAEGASLAYLAAASKYFGEFAHSGVR